jgi:hypothetical protein
MNNTMKQATLGVRYTTTTLLFRKTDDYNHTISKSLYHIPS